MNDKKGAAGTFPKPVDFKAQRVAIWGKRKFSKRDVAAMALAELHGERG